jgi:hypothetical protein
VNVTDPGKGAGAFVVKSGWTAAVEVIIKEFPAKTQKHIT